MKSIIPKHCLPRRSDFRLKSTALVSFLSLFLAPVGGAQADQYPSRPVKVVVPFGPGGGADLAARLIAAELGSVLKQPFVIDNRPGASAQIAAAAVAKAPADGYTLFFTTNTSHSANPWLFKELRYDPVRDFTPIARTFLAPFTLVVDARLPIQSIGDLIRYAKTSPTSYAYGNSTGQVAGAAIAREAKLASQSVGYKSTPQAMADIIGGNVTWMVVDAAASKELVAGGKLRAVATVGGTRSPLLPDLPASAETAGLSRFEPVAWGGIVGPAGMEEAIVAKLSAALQRAFAQPAFRSKLEQLLVEPAFASPSAFASFMDAQRRAWGKSIQAAGIHPE